MGDMSVSAGGSGGQVVLALTTSSAGVTIHPWHHLQPTAPQSTLAANYYQPLPFYDRVNIFGIAQTRNSPSRSKTVFPSIADSLSLFLPAFMPSFILTFHTFRDCRYSIQLQTEVAVGQIQTEPASRVQPSIIMKYSIFAEPPFRQKTGDVNVLCS